MTPGTREPLRIAAVSVFPDLGHIIPLLRLARALKREGMEVGCIVPEAAREAARRYGVKADFVERPVSREADRHLVALTRARSSLAYPLAERRLDHGRTIPAQLELARRFPDLRSRVEALNPDLVLSSAHHARPLYQGLARAVGRPLVTHDALGSLRHCQDEGVRRWGPVSPAWGSLRRPTEQFVRWAANRWDRLFVRHRWKADRDRWRRLERVFREVRAGWEPVPEHRISTGLAVLESRHLHGRIRVCPDVETFATVDPLGSEPLSDDLLTWLEDRPKPVVLVSFGTLIRPAPSVVSAILAGIRLAGARVLLVSSSAGLPPGSERRSDDWIRREQFVPQPDVLAHPQVRAFVTHAGYGGVQEAVWTGTPMLAVPLLWDQPYNAWTVEALGAGVTLDPRQCSRRRVAQSAVRLLEDQELRKRVAGLAREIRGEEGGRRVATFIRSLGKPAHSQLETVAYDR
jgi:UDP:flavonoid glycosyltransferase YjiC (YdhE family)